MSASGCVNQRRRINMSTATLEAPGLPSVSKSIRKIRIITSGITTAPGGSTTLFTKRTTRNVGSEFHSKPETCVKHGSVETHSSITLRRRASTPPDERERVPEPGPALLLNAVSSAESSLAREGRIHNPAAISWASRQSTLGMLLPDSSIPRPAGSTRSKPSPKRS